jgi:hypothetical protein
MTMFNSNLNSAALTQAHSRASSQPNILYERQDDLKYIEVQQMLKQE